MVAATAAAQATGTLPSIHPRASTGPGGAVDAVTSILLASSAAPYVEALRSSLLLDRVVAAAALTPGSIAAAMARVLVVLGVLGVVCAPVLVAAAGHLLLRMVAEVVVVAEAAAVVAARVVVAEATVAAVTATVAVVPPPEPVPVDHLQLELDSWNSLDIDHLEVEGPPSEMLLHYFFGHAGVPLCASLCMSTRFRLNKGMCCLAMSGARRFYLSTF